MTFEDAKTIPAKVEDVVGESSKAVSDTLSEWLKPLETTPLLYVGVVSVGLLLLLWILHFVFRFLVVRPLANNRLVNRSKWLNVQDLIDTRILSSIATLLSVLCIGMVVDLLPRMGAEYQEGADRVVETLFVFFAAQMIVRTGRLFDTVYSRLPSVGRPRAIQGYVSVGAFLVYGGALVLMVSIILDMSPLYFLTGLGAMSAILLILFRDTLLSMFANIIVTTGDLVRVGDWIHVPSSSADGYVIDISLNVVKVQNFDKTITVLPTYLLVQEAFLNYRGMYKSGGRRIKRSIMLDQRTIRPLGSADLDRLAAIPLMSQAMELQRTAPASESGGDRTTNSGLYRHYVLAYLKAHPKIHQKDFTMLVRQLQPTAEGLPLELYCFVNDTAWAVFEEVQATIFDQLLATLPAFGLRVYQGESDFQEPNPEPRRLEIDPAVFKGSEDQDKSG
ncbi:MAG: mechanosensitive ion channel [Phycisphaerales bacterium]|jgi:miniconductance mechanosensitive channel|nr:mechanosensitive ion channel [Phycisphaerales bacterium]